MRCGADSGSKLPAKTYRLFFEAHKMGLGFGPLSYLQKVKFINSATERLNCADDQG